MRVRYELTVSAEVIVHDDEYVGPRGENDDFQCGNDIEELEAKILHALEGVARTERFVRLVPTQVSIDL